VECRSHAGCYWNYDYCGGYVSDCNQVDTVNCASHAGCTVGGRCSGLDSCASIDAVSCAQRPGCTAQADCSGSVTACDYFDTAAEGARQAGCHWQ
jgi:hypothetical protein